MVGQSFDFEFAFDDIDFSDRVLRIELTSEFDSEESNRVPNRKRKRENLDTDTDTENVVKVKTLNVSSPILAANSPFFYKLFKNGMKESQERHVTMRIHASEEASLMDLLNFMYKGTLNATTNPDLRDVLIVADKFEVTSCMRYCSDLLKEMPLSLESAILYLELPSCEVVQPLKDVAKKYLIENFKDFSKGSTQEMAMELPLFALEVVLGIDGLKVFSEAGVFNFILKWSRAHYSKLEERQEILTKRLARFIYFPYMTYDKLEEVLSCPDFVREQVYKLVLEALHLSAGYPYGQGILLAEDGDSPFVIKRAYKLLPIKVVHFKSSRPQCLVDFYLTKDDVKSLYPSKQIESDRFLLGGERLFGLVAKCHKEHHQFGLFVERRGVCKRNDLSICSLDYEFSAKKKTSMEFQSMFKTNNEKFNAFSWGKPNLFGIPWTNFISDESEYFINGILHLQAKITLNFQD